mgnify:CR=1 FL=1
MMDRKGYSDMVNNEPLIPPPSIGESAESKAIPKIKKQKKGSKLWMIVLACVVVGVGLGVVVYQQSIAPAPKPSTTPRPTVAALPSPVAIPSPSIAPISVSQVTPSGNEISYPKAGEVRVYFSNYSGSSSVLLDMESASGGVGVQIVGNGSSTSMPYLDTGFVLPGAEKVTIGAFDGGDYDKPGYGWIPPKADNTCGGDGSQVHPDITSYINWATEEAEGEPLVSIQCWGDWGGSGDPSNADFNDYVVIWSYTPSSVVSSPTPTPSASPGASATATPTPTPTASSSTTTTTPTPSPRVTQPEGETLPEAGVFEVTMGTISVGLLFLVLGLAGLLVL